jgi:uncharacterized protein (DUF4415 family)
MTEKESYSDHVLVKSDLAKVDAHVIAPEEYEDLPEWTEEMFAEADFYHGEKLIRRGRPRSLAPKEAINIRLSADVLERFRATGQGWQTRMDSALKQWLVEHGREIEGKPEAL